MEERNPSFQWMVNDEPVGDGSPYFSYMPEDGDQVKTVMTSSISLHRQ